LDSLSDEWLEESMTSKEEFLRQVRGLIASLDNTLTASERLEVEHFIDHNEIGEALTTLAWIIVNESKRIPASAYQSIIELSEGLVDPEHLPKDLATHVVGNE
jgi:flagellar biosynthesis regulator FlbT